MLHVLPFYLKFLLFWFLYTNKGLYLVLLEILHSYHALLVTVNSS